jgi:site-specific DNA-adenine methylase
MKQKLNRIISRVGAKGEVAEIMVAILQMCQVDYGLSRYIEATGGSGVILLNIPQGCFDEMIFNEINPCICALFKVLKDFWLTNALIENIEELGYSEETFEEAVETYQKYREKKEDFLSDENSLVEAATAAYIVFKQSKRADTKTFDETKQFSSAYYNKLFDLPNFNYILEDVTVMNRDCNDVIDEYCDSEETVILIDPPYVPDAMSNAKHYEREEYWSNEDHIKFVKKLLAADCKIILHGYPNEIYEKLEDNGWNRYFLKRQRVKIARKGGVFREEFIWCNFGVSETLLDGWRMENCKNYTY